MKTALMLSIIPPERVAGHDMPQAANMKDSPDARARLKFIAQKRMARGQAMPMDIGRVGDKDYEDDGINFMNTGNGNGK
jgi:hypothetical protein